MLPHAGSSYTVASSMMVRQEGDTRVTIKHAYISAAPELLLLDIGK
jgi:hypothetical protein